MVKYCSRDCQVAHRPKHKKECKRRAAELFDIELFKEPPEREECPICMLPLPFHNLHSLIYSCCGKTICCGCVHAQKKEGIKNGKSWEDCEVCPFCRTPAPSTAEDREIIDRINKCVERNDAKSMEQLAMHYRDGNMGLQKDLTKAMELFQKAGELGCASAYCDLGNLYYHGLEDLKKGKHYWELGAIGGCMVSRHNLAIAERRNGNGIRAYKHFLICIKAGYEPSLIQVKPGFQHGYITEDECSEAIRTYQKQCDDIKSDMRDEALVYEANPSLYYSNS